MLKEKPDEFGYLTELPSNVRPIFQHICKEVAFISELFAFYFHLFDNTDNISIINATAPRPFQIIESNLRTSIIMSISRLSDNMIFRKDINLCMSTLVMSVANIDDLLLGKLKAFHDSCKPIKKWRNKVIAHNDYDYLSKNKLGKLPRINKNVITAILDAAKDLLNHIAMKYSTSQVGFLPAMFRDADELMLWIKSGLTHEKECPKRFLTP